MIEVHGEEFLGEYKSQFRGGESRAVEDVVCLSLGTHNFAKISERDAFERIKAALRKANIDWIHPTTPSEWTFKLEGFQKVIDTRVDVPWLNGTVVAKPEFNANLRDSSGTHIGTADFVFYFTAEMVAKSTEASARSTVFVSYSHFQEKWVERLAVHLKPLQRKGRVDLFDDTKIQAGADWRNEIKAALKRAKVAILLISADFLASDFIAENELPPLLEKAQAGGATIIPVIVSPSRFTKIERLVTYQAINDPRVPLEGMDYASSEAVLVRVADAVVDALDRGREGQQLPGNVAMLRSDDSVPCAIVGPGASNMVESPFIPGRYFDVSGYRSGQQVIDPYTGKPVLCLDPHGGWRLPCAMSTQVCPSAIF